MSPELFTRAGRAAFGDRWHAPMADALECRVDTVRHMARGHSRIGVGMSVRVLAVLRSRADALAAVSHEVDKSTNELIENTGG